FLLFGAVRAAVPADLRFADLQCPLGGLFLLPQVDFFHQGIDHFTFEDVADDLAALEDDALALAGGDAQVCFAGFARAVDDAAQDADLDGGLATREALVQVLHQLFQVDLDAAAGRAGDQLGLADAALGRLENIEGCFDPNLFRGQ